MEFWLSSTGSTETLNLGDNVKEIEIGASERSFDLIENVFSGGGIIKGIGTYSPKNFRLSRDEWITTSSEYTAFNPLRSTFTS